MAHGFGKIILFGEHFVVYGLPAIVGAIKHKIEASIKMLPNAKEHLIVDNCTYFKNVSRIGDSPEKIAKGQQAINAIFDHLNIKEKFAVTFFGDLPIPNSGIGSSAAMMVALARAINIFFNLKLSEEEINLCAFEGEKQLHGNPSGIDNTAATYGGVFLFKRGTPPTIEKIKLSKPMHVVLIESGIETDTKTVVESVQKFVQENREKSETIFKQYETIATKAKIALQNQDFLKKGITFHVGQLLNKNHELLQQLTVSCTEQDKIVECARNAGALGAKLTGTGRGGLVIALAQDEENAENIVREIKLLHKNYDFLKTTIV